MARVVFTGVSPRSLGDLLKGYGIMAVLGESHPNALFWWDEAFHLVAEIPIHESKIHKSKIIDGIRANLLAWARQTSQKFQPRRGQKCNQPLPCRYHGPAKRGTQKRCQGSSFLISTPAFHDELDPDLARFARAVAVIQLPQERLRGRMLESSPLFPHYGQEASGNYFSQIDKAWRDAACTPDDDLRWSLFAQGTPSLKRRLESGYLFFPEPMKRYATGVKKWVREGDAPISPWCFLLAMRGAMMLRGSLRRLRWRRNPYAAFPFVFGGRDPELYLPTWTQDRPRTLQEFEMQIRQFQARFSNRGLAATAAEFRVAVVGRGVGAAFDTFHRFVIEGRRPTKGEKRLPQAIPRGYTRVGGFKEESSRLRLMLAPIAEEGWSDQFVDLRQENRLWAGWTRLEETIHRAVDEPGLEAYREVLEALWDLNREIVLHRFRDSKEDSKKVGRTLRPLPPLPVRPWLEALGEGFRERPEYRLGRAIGSILGIRPVVGPVLEHMLPLRWDWTQSCWRLPDQESSRPGRWSGWNPLADFRELFWSRWLDSHELDSLPFHGCWPAPLADIDALLRGNVDLREVHRLAALFALLDWQGWQGEKAGLADLEGSPSDFGGSPRISPAYAALRLWLELGIRPAIGRRPPRDGTVARLLTLGGRAQVIQAACLALRRLRLEGLPCQQEPRPTGKAVADFRPSLSDDEAARMVVAVLVPISNRDKEALARQLWVPTDIFE
jgi:CRISPR-associated protein Csx17